MVVVVALSAPVASAQQTKHIGELLQPLPGYTDEDTGQAGIDAISSVIRADLDSRGFDVVATRNYKVEGSDDQATAYVIGRQENQIPAPLLASDFFCPETLSVRGMGVCEESGDGLYTLSWGNSSFILRTFSRNQSIAERLMVALILANTTPVAATGHSNRAAGLQLPSLTGKKPLRLGDLTGEVVVVNFWSSKCESCSQENGPLARVASSYGPTAGVRVVRIVHDEKAASARAAVKELGVAYDVVTDPKGKAAKALDVTDAPSTFILNRDGRVIAEIREPINDRTLTTGVDAALFGNPPG